MTSLGDAVLARRPHLVPRDLMHSTMKRVRRAVETAQPRNDRVCRVHTFSAVENHPLLNHCAAEPLITPFEDLNMGWLEFHQQERLREKTEDAKLAGPSMAIRAHAEPCVALMGKDDQRVEGLRKSWAPEWAK